MAKPLNCEAAVLLHVFGAEQRVRGAAGQAWGSGLPLGLGVELGFWSETAVGQVCSHVHSVYNVVYSIFSLQ